MTDLGTFAGRFHPLVVHLPIGILLIAAVLEVLARTRRFGAVRAAVGPTLVLGAVGAAVAAATGWLLGSTGGYAGDTYTWHLRMGVGVAVGAVLTATAYHWGTWGRASALQAGAYPVLLALTVAHVAAAGHLGGTLTHGEGYLVEHAPTFLRFGGAGRAGVQPRAANDVIVYEALVEPVLQRRCVSCHGAETAQGGLRLDSPDGIRKGGEGGPVLAAGRPDASELIRRIWLPSSHEDAMPPRGTRPPTVVEAALLHWWIEEGASFDATLADANVPARVQPAIEAALGPIDPGAPAILAVQVPPADAGAVEALRATGISITPLAEGTPFLSVHCTNVAESFGDEQLAALGPIAQQVTWLSLSGTRVTDEGAAALAQFVNLTRLHLDGTRVTDAALPHLSGLQRLEYLNLVGTVISDAGLQQLTGLRALRTLYVWQTATTAAGVERLRAGLPQLQVEAGVAPLAAPGQDAAGVRGGRL